MIKMYDGDMKMYWILGMSLNVHFYPFKMSAMCSYCQVTFIYITPYIIQIVSKRLHGNKHVNNSVNVAKFINYETT